MLIFPEQCSLSERIVLMFQAVMVMAIIILIQQFFIIRHIRREAGVRKFLKNFSPETAAGNRSAVSGNRILGSAERYISSRFATLKDIKGCIHDNCGKFAKIAEELLVEMYNLNTNIGKINGDLDKVTTDNKTIAETIDIVSTNLHDVSTTNMSITNDISQIAMSAHEVSGLVNESLVSASKTKDEFSGIHRLSGEISGLAEKLNGDAMEISKIIDTIKDITDRTNLLALNASIEAARAGDAGRGFSVVADEIGKLADNNTQSAKVIENLIGNIQNTISGTISSINNIGTKIEQGSSHVSGLYEQLRKATGEVGGISSTIQGIASSAEEMSASSEEIDSMMQEINQRNKSIVESIREVSEKLSGQVTIIRKLDSFPVAIDHSIEELFTIVNRDTAGELL